MTGINCILISYLVTAGMNTGSSFPSEEERVVDIKYIYISSKVRYR